jgi:hypothetical protein
MFINAEWGIKVDLFPSEDQFKSLIESNAQKLLKGAIIQFRDVLSLIRKRFNLSQENVSNLRFLHAEELRFVTKSDYPIFQANGKTSTFIIQSKEPGLIAISTLGLKHGFQDIIDKIKEIGEGFHKFVSYDPEMLVSQEQYNLMYEEIDSKVRITQQTTKVFFRCEAYIAALHFILKKFKEIYQQKYF